MAGSDYSGAVVTLDSIEFSELDPGDVAAIYRDGQEAPFVEINSSSLVYELGIVINDGSYRLETTGGDGFSLSRVTISAVIV